MQVKIKDNLQKKKFDYTIVKNTKFSRYRLIHFFLDKNYPMIYFPMNEVISRGN